MRPKNLHIQKKMGINFEEQEAGKGNKPTCHHLIYLCQWLQTNITKNWTTCHRVLIPNSRWKISASIHIERNSNKTNESIWHERETELFQMVPPWNVPNASLVLMLCFEKAIWTWTTKKKKKKRSDIRAMFIKKENKKLKPNKHVDPENNNASTSQIGGLDSSTEHKSNWNFCSCKLIKKSKNQVIESTILPISIQHVYPISFKDNYLEHLKRTKARTISANNKNVPALTMTSKFAYTEVHNIQASNMAVRTWYTVRPYIIGAYIIKTCQQHCNK